MRYLFDDAKARLTALCSAVLLTCCGDAPTPATLTTQEVTLAQPLLKGHACQDGEYDETGLVRTDVGLFSYICTGTLIAPDVVLTAAHCVQEGATATFIPQASALSFVTFPVPVARAVVAPAFNLEAMSRLPLMLRIQNPLDEAEHEAVQALREACGNQLAPNAKHVYETFDALALYRCILTLPEKVQKRLDLSLASREVDDIALLFLEEPVPWARTAALPAPSQPWERSDKAVVVGYGENSLSWWRWFTGQSFGARFSGSAAIRAVGSHEIVVSPNPTRVRKGDSGGPLFVNTEDGRVVVGVASRSDFSPESDYFYSGLAFYTRVDAYVDWIAGEIKAFRAARGK